jgi:hypothetical protein
MPKKVYKINNFHGGLNNSSDPRDVDDKEITAATNVMVDEVGRVRLTGSNVDHDAPVLNNTGAGVTQTPGSGLFYFSHDRKGGEDAGDDEYETADNYLALYDDSDAQVWVYSDAGSDWDDDKDSANNGVINFIGKTTSAAARPCFYSVDGAVRVSTGEFSKYDSTTDVNMVSHFLSTSVLLTVDAGTAFAVGNYIQIDDEILFVSAISSAGGSGGEQISSTNDRTFAGASNWANAAGSNAFNAYDETTGGVLTVTPDDDGSNAQYAILDGAHWEDDGGASGVAMVAGRTYRLSYTLTVSSYTKGRLDVGFANASHTLQTDHYNTYAATSSAATRTLDFVYGGVSADSEIIIRANTNSVFTAIFDNFSIDELHVLTVTRAMFGTKDTQHQDNTDIYILNMNQWYGYLNNNFFQTSAGVSEYTTNKWYNEIQHLRSFDELGVSLVSDDSSAAGPTTSEMDANTIIFSYWTSPSGFWSGSYYLGATPVYVDGQEGPISTVGTTPIGLSEEVLNVQMYVCHPSIEAEAISSHPLIDDRIVGVKLYTKTYTSNEWFLLKNFDLLEGGEHGWKEYQSGNAAAGIWTDGSASMDNPVSDQSYARTTADITVTPGTAMDTDGHGANRTGKIRVSGFEVSPIYGTVNLNSTAAQEQEFNVVNPGPGLAPFIIEVLDENYDVLYTTQVTKTIADSGISTPHITEDSGYTGEDLYHSECFLNGTQILMSSGSMKNISDIIIGDSIASYSSMYKSYVSGIVTDVLIHPIGGYVNVAIIDDRLFGTPSHPILVDGKWVEIHMSGLDVLYKRMFVDAFYNLEVDGANIFGSDHNYVANGFIVSGLGDNDILNRAIPRQDIFIGTNNG